VDPSPEEIRLLATGHRSKLANRHDGNLITLASAFAFPRAAYRDLGPLNNTVVSEEGLARCHARDPAAERAAQPCYRSLPPQPLSRSRYKSQISETARARVDLTTGSKTLTVHS